MAHTIHTNARTTPAVRREIQMAAPTVQDATLVRKYGVTRQTIAKWRKRDEITDGSHRPKEIHATLSPEQETVVVALRETLLLSLDDLLVVAREFLEPKLSRSALDRCLRRHGVSNLKAIIRAQQPEEPQPGAPKTFKDYEPGFVHVDVKYLPQMPDEPSRSYLFAGIDRATRWVYLEIRRDKTAETAKGFLSNLLNKAPFKVSKVLTDNGKEFTDRFCATGQRKPTGEHLFDQLCEAHAIEHRLAPPRHPQTNGMVERFNGRIADILKTRRFDSAWDLKQTMYNYRDVYNHHIPQKALGHITPIAALKQWQEKRPDLFLKRVYNQAGLDNYQPRNDPDTSLCI